MAGPWNFLYGWGSSRLRYLTRNRYCMNYSMALALNIPHLCIMYAGSWVVPLFNIALFYKVITTGRLLMITAEARFWWCHYCLLMNSAMHGASVLFSCTGIIIIVCLLWTHLFTWNSLQCRYFGSPCTIWLKFMPDWMTWPGICMGIFLSGLHCRRCWFPHSVGVAVSTAGGVAVVVSTAGGVGARWALV